MSLIKRTQIKNIVQVDQKATRRPRPSGVEERREMTREQEEEGRPVEAEAGLVHCCDSLILLSYLTREINIES